MSLPSLELFLAQDESYRRSLLPDDGTPIVAIEAGRAETLRRFVGRRGLVIGMESFGASAPYSSLAEHFGFNAKNVVARVKAEQRVQHWKPTDFRGIAQVPPNCSHPDLWGLVGTLFGSAFGG